MASDVTGVELDALSVGADAILSGDDSETLPDLVRLGSAISGARPKISIARNATEWIVKFRHSSDPLDIGPIEAAYADMARAAGIDIMPTTLIASKSGPGYFATQRFDRGDGGTRSHVLSVAAMLDIDFTQPSIEYGQLLRLVRFVTGSAHDVEQMFRRMVFNVFAHNRDDHTKQHVFIMDADGTWQLAPAFDLTPSPGPGGEHYLAVNGKGTNIGVEDILVVGKSVDIKRGVAYAIIDDVHTAIKSFAAIAKSYGVSSASVDMIRGMFVRVR
jgi:serine/threonine-protein kinase HipA